MKLNFKIFTYIPVAAGCVLSVITTTLSLAIVLFAANASAVTAHPKLDSIITLPVRELKAVEINGEILFMSQNGRFVIRGQLTDTWQKTTLDTVKEISYASTHIDIDVMGLPLEKMNTITIEGGPERLIVFVDPQCKYCKEFIKEAMTNTEKYTFIIVVVPALGDRSHEMSKALFCSSDKRNALQTLLDEKLGDMRQKENCNTKHYDLTLTVAQLFDIKSVPFFIAPDGRYKSGAGKGFWDWVQRKS